MPSCSDSDAACTDTVLDRIADPTGHRAAVVFDRSCGATTGNSVQMSILPTDASPTGPGTVLIFDSAIYTQAARPVWRPDGSLLVTLPTGARVFRQAAQVDGTPVIYSAP